MKIVKKRKLHRFHPYIILKIVKKTIQNRKTKLFPFQDHCLEWIKYRRQENKSSIIIPSETGTGKTLIAFAHCEDFGWNSLWIVPNMVIGHHKDELKKHFNKNPRNNTIIGFTEFSRISPTNPIFSHKYKTIVLDEIHLIKKYTNLSKNLKKLKTQFFIGLSASTDFFDFTDIPIFINLDETTQIYKQCAMKFEDIPIQQIKCLLSVNDREAYIKQQTSISTSKCAMAKVNHMREWLSNNRVDILIEYLKKNKCFDISIKMVIFSDFNSTLLKLCLLLPVGSFMRLDTAISVKKRHAFIQKFETSSNIKFLLCNRKIGGVGIDLGFVDIVFLAEVAYNQSETNQAIGRMQRIGQKPQNLDKQLIFEFLYENSCESNIAQSKIPFKMK